jgi:hypothetical protein
MNQRDRKDLKPWLRNWPAPLLIALLVVVSPIGIVAYFFIGGFASVAEVAKEIAIEMKKFCSR